jgi:type I restriction enzyme, R subunit
LNEEEKRAMGEQLDEEELALFEATARDLLKTLKTWKLVLDWRKRQQARAEVRVTIEKVLDQGLPGIYAPELFEQKTTAVFQHVYDAYYGAGRSAYISAQ